ncbi:MAG: hypothetical protein ABC378_00090 [Staphylococcus pseudoxylosus]|uniref:hypothetical protein n=1 Tax=Staphylococcus pseudoxylosus TaxID=2282419 RepID=UPI0031F6A85F
MGLSQRYTLKDKNLRVVATVIPLDRNRNSVAGLKKSFGLDEDIVTDERLEEIKSMYNLNDREQTSIFDYL